MNKCLQYLHGPLVLLTIMCLHKVHTDAGIPSDDKFNGLRSLWPEFYDDLDSDYNEHFSTRGDELKKSREALNLMYLLQHGPSHSRQRKEHFSVVNKRTHDVETSIGSFDDNSRELIRETKSGRTINGFDNLLKAARMLDNLEDSSSFHPWAG